MVRFTFFYFVSLVTGREVPVGVTEFTPTTLPRSRRFIAMGVLWVEFQGLSSRDVYFLNIVYVLLSAILFLCVLCFIVITFFF